MSDPEPNTQVRAICRILEPDLPWDASATELREIEALKRMSITTRFDRARTTARAILAALAPPEPLPEDVAAIEAKIYAIINSDKSGNLITLIAHAWHADRQRAVEAQRKRIILILQDDAELYERGPGTDLRAAYLRRLIERIDAIRARGVAQDPQS